MADSAWHDWDRHWPLVGALPAEHEILVVVVDLAEVAVQVELLDERERERGRRLRTPRLQHLYLAAHTALRQILGWQLRVDPATLAFALDAREKPSLIGHRLSFNLSHSGSLALLATATDGALGVDLECGERLGDLEHVAECVFAPTEQSRFLALPPHDRPRAFLSAWTRKEAALKALGIGLPGGMENVILADAPLHVSGDFNALPALQGLHVVDLPALPGYAGALCYGPVARAVRCGRWAPATTSVRSRELPTAGTT